MGIHQSEEVYSKIKELLDIPEDEPIFIMRAQDQFSVPTLADYLNNVVNGTDNTHNTMGDWFDSMREKGNEFLTWQRTNEDKVKVPD
jgi:hypothetical protein